MASQSTASLKLYAAFLTCGLIWAAVQTYLIHSFGFSWYIAAADGLVSSVLLGASCWLINNTLRYYQPSKGSYINILVWYAALAAMCAYGCRWLLPLLTADVAYTLFLVNSVFIRAFIDFLAIGWMAMISIIYYSMIDQKENEKPKPSSWHAMPSFKTCASSCSPTFCLIASIL